MTRIAYLIKAQTQYDIHSPFVFSLYREVLFAPLPHDAVVPSLGKGCRRYNELCYKLQRHFHLRPLSASSDTTLFQSFDGIGDFCVVNRPHRSRQNESQWSNLCKQYRVSIDLYDVGLLLSNPHLHPQHFLLR